MDDTPRTQRAFARAYGDGELDRSEAATALERYDELDASGEDTADDLIATTGDDGVDLLANAVGDTVRVALDGSGSLDESFRRSLARAADGETIDSYAQLDRAVRDIEDLSGPRQRRAKELVADTEGEGIRLIDEMDDSSTSQLLDTSVSRPERFRAQLARFSDEDQFSVGRSEQFLRDAEELKSANVDGFDDGSGSIIDEFTTQTNADFQARGIQYETRVAANGDINDIEAVGRNVRRSNGDTITDIDVERRTEIVEARSSMTTSEAESKLERFEEAHEVGEIDLNEKDIAFTTDEGFSVSDRAEIREMARNIEDRSGNGIDDLTVEFNQVDAVESN